MGDSAAGRAETHTVSVSAVRPPSGDGSRLTDSPPPSSLRAEAELGSLTGGTAVNRPSAWIRP